MTDFIVSGPQSGQQLIDENDTLAVTGTGSIVTSDEAILWDLDPSSSVPPGVVIVNDGLIQSLDDRAIDTDNASDGPRSLSLTNNGTITSPDDAIRIDDSLVGGTVWLDNSGLIQSTDDGQAIDFNGVDGALWINIFNREGGVIYAADADALRPGGNATVFNYGHIKADSDADGIDFQENSDGAVYNYGTGLIEGGGHGITGDEAVTVFNDVGGRIIGHNGSAVNIDNGADVEDTVYVTNYDTMEGRSAEIDDSDGDAVDVDGLLSLDNHGAIRGLGHEGYHDGEANVSEGVAAGGGVINNFADGVIYGYGRGIQIDNSGNGGAYAATTITNEGRIEGGGHGPEGVDPEDILPLTPIGSEAIKLVGDWNDLLINSGTIVGGVMMGGGGDRLANAGSMEALNGSAIDMEDGNDEVALFTGSSLKGALLGGAGDDVLGLFQGEDADETTGTIAEVSGFEELVVFGGSWTMLDAQSYANGAYVAGAAELVLGGNGALDAPVTVDGRLAVDRADAFVLATALDGTGMLEQRGTGTTVIAQANAYAGGTLITGGALHLSAFGAVGSGAVSFDHDGGETLIIDDAALTGNAFANTVTTLGRGDAIEFTGLAFVAGTSVDYDTATDLVTVTGKGETYTFTLVAPESSKLVAVEDGMGGTKIMLKDVGVSIRGSKKADVIDGQSTVLGQDVPTNADDQINGRRGDDKIAGLGGNDVIIGAQGNDKLAGGAGNDWLHGGVGNNNKLTGNAGMDAFVFDTKLGSGSKSSSFAKIADFEIGKDQILLDSKVFKALDPGALSSDAFAIGKKAKGDDVHILYKNGQLRYDADGEGGKDAVFFAKVNNKPALDADDFLVV